jgi:ComF family protein
VSLLSEIQAIDDLIMPRRCVFCGVRSYAEEKSVCWSCRTDLPWIEFSCNRCAEPLSVETPAAVNCAACQRRPPPLIRSVAPLEYSFPIDAAIKALKFNRKLFYAPALSEILCASSSSLPADIDVILPVPLHWRRKAMRGFNQATELGKPLARHLGLPLLKGVCRQQATPFQSGLAASERLRNLRQAFACSKPIAHKHVLIVDDVITTGATTRQLAIVLLASGAKKVSALAVARASLRIV